MQAPLPPLVSIIMPMYNASAYVLQSIMSVQTQTYANWELIIVDDCSIDDSIVIVEKILSDHRVILIKNQKNLGIAEARNIAVAEAKGRYIAFLDSDDLWLTTKLEQQLDFMRNTNFPICYASYYTINMHGDRTGLRTIPACTNYQILLKANHIGTLTAIYDTLFFSKQYFLNLHHEDYEMWLRLFKKLPHHISGIQAPLAEYRVYSGSKSSNKFKTVLWRWNIYRNTEKLSFIKASYYLTNSAFNVLIRAIKSKLIRHTA